MSVITISREAGSAGTQIAEEVAANLGYTLVDKQTLGTMLAKYGLISFKQVYDSVPTFWDGFDSQATDQRSSVLAMMNKAILAIAHRGNAVIVGRGGYVVLGIYADVLNVRIQAPFTTRVKRVQDELKTADIKLAEKDVKERDRVRLAFMDSAYGLKAEPVSAFDIVVNTGKIDQDKAVHWIVDASLALDGGEGPRVANIDIDPVLADVVAEIMGS